MKSLGKFFLTLAPFFAVLFAAGASLVQAAEPSEKLKLLQEKAADLYQAGS